MFLHWNNKSCIYNIPDVTAPADASQAFSFQFGSISPGFMNGMQVFATVLCSYCNLQLSIFSCLLTEGLCSRFLLEQAQLPQIWTSRNVTRYVCSLPTKQCSLASPLIFLQCSLTQYSKLHSFWQEMYTVILSINKYQSGHAILSTCRHASIHLGLLLHYRPLLLSNNCRGRR